MKIYTWFLNHINFIVVWKEKKAMILFNSVSVKLLISTNTDFSVLNMGWVYFQLSVISIYVTNK